MMQIEVSKQDLVQTLKFVAATVAKSGDDLSGHYLFRLVPDTTDAVEVLSYDGKVSSSARLTCKYTATEGGVTAFTFEARRLDMWLNAVPDAALTLEHKDGTTTAFSPLGNQKFQSLDPSKFPYWDALLAEAKPTTKVLANRLKAALQYARPFIYADETKHPHLCQVQFRDGNLYATDTATAVAVKLVGFEQANFSVSGKSLSNLLTFLSQCGDGEVEIREHEHMVLYCLAGTAIFGESRMHAQFPKLSLGLDNPNQQTWKLNRGEITNILNFLLSAAPKDNEHLILSDASSDSAVKMGMAVAAGGTKHLEISCAGKVKQDGAAALPDKGFKVRYGNLQKVLAAHSTEDVLVGINAKGTGGWLRFDESRDGDNYYAIVQWSN